uniref:Putative secreted protein n=1 Tax=Anopheles darlingi TaxID=43151 RepID=A0A2M4D2X3_ANODA
MRDVNVAVCSCVFVCFGFVDAALYLLQGQFFKDRSSDSLPFNLSWCTGQRSMWAEAEKELECSWGSGEEECES